MTDDHDRDVERTDSTRRTDDRIVIEQAPPAAVQQPAPVVEERKMSVGSFIAGFLTAVVVGAIALGVFLVVSDSDDDGQIDVEVPAVDVDVDE